MDIKRNGSQPSSKGPAEWFIGSVRVDPLFEAPVPARALGASVTFEPAAPTAWHTHPLGQTLIVTSGCGRMQRWGGPIEEIRPGDVVGDPLDKIIVIHRDKGNKLTCLFPNHFVRILIFPNTEKDWLAEPVIPRPFREFSDKPSPV
jgi:hypothetical protein